MLELVQCTFEGHGDFPWAIERILKFVDAAFCSIGLNCMMVKDNVSNQVGVGIRSSGINQLLMTHPLLLD